MGSGGLIVWMKKTVWLILRSSILGYPLSPVVMCPLSNWASAYEIQIAFRWVRTRGDIELLRELSVTIKNSSLCGLGKLPNRLINH